MKNQKLLLQLLLGAILSSSLVLFSCGGQGSKTEFELPDTVEFVQHIAPIIHTHCTPCHKQGGGGPFDLITYNQVAKRSKMIAFVTKSRYMPPWPADKEYSHFANERGLSEREIALLYKWYETGAIRGDGVVEWKQGISGKDSPDLILPIYPMQVLGNNTDQFYVVKVPFEIPKDTFVRLVEFISGSKQIVHHANGHLLNYQFEKKQNVFDGKYYMNTNADEATYLQEFDSLQLLHDDRTFPIRVHSAINYLPGMKYFSYPEGIGGFPIHRKGAFVLNDIHYGPYPKNIIDSSYLHVYYAKNPPKRPFQEVMLGTNGVSEIVPKLIIPPGEIKTFQTKWEVPFDISMVSINPHMHLLGKSIKAYAVKPNADTIPLIYIPKWDFRWQYVYSFERLLRLPKGTVVMVEATFDNTSANPNNPYSPPQEISERLDRNGASMRTTDEMLQFIITALPYKKGDENISLKSTNIADNE